jgi:hypothetical protein
LIAAGRLGKKQVKKVSIDGVTVKLGILGANASRVHPPLQKLDAKTEKFLQNEDARGNVDATFATSSAARQ